MLKKGAILIVDKTITNKGVIMAGDGAVTLKDEVRAVCEITSEADRDALLEKITSNLKDIEDCFLPGSMSAEDKLRLIRRRCIELRVLVERI